MLRTISPRALRRHVLAPLAVLLMTTAMVGVVGIRPAAALNGDEVSIDDVSSPEGTDADPDATTIFTFTVTVTDAGGGTPTPGSGGFTVDWETEDETAKGGDGCGGDVDYIADNDTITFELSAMEEQSETIEVEVCPDSFGETDETFFVNLDNIADEDGPPDTKGDADFTKAVGVGTIQNDVDDGAPPSLSISDAAPVVEEAGVNAEFTVTSDPAPGQTVTVDYTAVSGSATSGNDFTATSGTLTFSAGDATKTVLVPVREDALDEDDETFTVRLSNATNAEIDDTADAGTGTILDDDPRPTISVADASAPEGNSGASNTVDFTVSLSTPSGRAVTVDYSTEDVTAEAGVDYTSVAPTQVTFAPLQTTATVSVNVIGDTVKEPNETFLLRLTNPTNATISDATATGTIANDDDVPTISISNEQEDEGNSGTTDFVFTVTVDGDTTETVTVDYDTADGTADAGTDYTSTSGTLTFTPGTPDAKSQTVTVPVAGDTSDEFDETFFVNLSDPTNATIASGQGQGTIIDDDDLEEVSIDDVVVDENASPASFTVSLSEASGKTVTVGYSTASQTAEAGEDFVPAAGDVEFAPGETVKTIEIEIIDDSDHESDETFAVNITASNATVTDGQGIGTITDDETGADLSIDDVSQLEDHSGTSPMRFIVTLNGTSDSEVTVGYATADQSARAGSDYVAESGTLTFAPGDTEETLDIAINGDTTVEPDEVFKVTLSNPTGGAAIADGEGLGTIENDDGGTPASLAFEADVNDDEGHTGSTTFTFTVNRSGESNVAVTVDYTTVAGTAAAGEDYEPTVGSLTFESGDNSQTIIVTVNGDVTFEDDESFTVVLSNPSNATITDGEAVGTIRNDDDEPSVSIATADVDEPDTGTTEMTFSLSLSNPSENQTTVEFSTGDMSDTATAGSDYTAKTGIVTFAPGVTERTLTVTVIGDEVHEDDETFTVTLTDPVGGTIASPPTATGTITDNDDLPSLSINDVSVVEGDSGTVDAVFTVTKAGATAKTVTVDFETVEGTATAGDDYVSTSGTLTFLPGETSKTITVAVKGDETAPEEDETFTVELSESPTNATIADGSGTGTITDDDDLPVLSIDDETIEQEGDDGPVNAEFTVTLSEESAKIVTVDYQTISGTATAGDDYESAGGTLTFNPGDPGETSKTVTVTVNGDTIDEDDETFTVQLSNASNATIADGTATGTITDDDLAPALSIDDVTVPEGDSGTTDAKFAVTLSAPSGKTVTVDYETADDTATAGEDYEEVATDTLTFDPGETSKTVTVVVNGDTTDEDDETFTVELSEPPTNATIADGSGTGTITDDDGPPPVSIDDVTVSEGDSGTTDAEFTVSLSFASDQTVTVDYATADGTATAGEDYDEVATDTLTFDPGQTSKTVTVLVNGDTIDEANETFTVELSNASNATIADGSGTGTITDDDGPPALSIDDVTVTEGDSGTTDAVFTATLSPASGQTVTVDYATADGTAKAPADYTATSGTLTFAAGETSKTVTVAVNGDTSDEPAESFNVELSNAANATVTDGSGTATINDDDAPPALSINDVTVTEGDGGTANAGFTVTLAAASGKTVTVDFATADATATAPADYTATNGTLTFSPGQTSKELSVAVKGDAVEEGDETFTVTLSNATNATLADSSGTGTIRDDDAAEQGYTIVGGDGGIFTFGEAEFFGSMGGQELNSPVISMAYTPTGEGYWLVAGDGGIFSFGDATFHGSMGGQTLNSPVIGMESTPTGQGYWLFAADGGIFSFGDAAFHGSMGAAPLNAPVVTMAATAAGSGYWLVAQDGGIFSFGDATFHGSTGGMSLVEPVFDMDATADDGGYWLVARDGGIFAFGNATFHGSAAGQGATTVIGMGATPAALGYWIADDRGAVFIFGDARFFGDLRNVTLNAPAVGFAALPG